jgi:ribosomal protein S18 acetylase RimI-like enzyme
MSPADQAQLSLRAATPADVPFLIELRRLTMTAHQMASGVLPSDEERRMRVLARFDCAKVVCQNDQPIGLLKVVREGKHWEVVQFQLRPEWQRQGLGTKLLTVLVAEARSAGASLRLSVLKANPARGLYERFGFSVTEEKAHSITMQLG